MNLIGRLSLVSWTLRTTISFRCRFSLGNFPVDLGSSSNVPVRLTLFDLLISLEPPVTPCVCVDTILSSSPSSSPLDVCVLALIYYSQFCLLLVRKARPYITMVVLRRCVARLGAALLSLSLLSPALAIKMLYDDSLPEDLPSACSAALMADVACDALVPNLRPDFFYPPASLHRICTAGCAAALESWESSVRSACGKDVVIPAEFDLPASPIVIPTTRRYIYSYTCLEENNVFCGPVAALASFFSDPGSKFFFFFYCDIYLPRHQIDLRKCVMLILSFITCQFPSLTISMNSPRAPQSLRTATHVSQPGCACDLVRPTLTAPSWPASLSTRA